MKIGGDGDAECVAFFRKFAPVGEDFEIEFLTHPDGGFGIDIENTDDFGLRIFTVKPRVMAAESANAKYADLEFRLIFCHDGTFSPRVRFRI